MKLPGRRFVPCPIHNSPSKTHTTPAIPLIQDTTITPFYLSGQATLSAVARSLFLSGSLANALFVLRPVTQAAADAPRAD